MTKWKKLLESAVPEDIVIGLCQLEKSGNLKNFKGWPYTKCEWSFVVQFDDYSVWVRAKAISVIRPVVSDGRYVTNYGYYPEFDLRTKKEEI